MADKPWSRTKAKGRTLAGGGMDGRWIDEKSRLVLAACHPRQRAFVEDPGRRVCALVGRGGGKTTGGRARFVLRMLRTPRAKCVYIATTRVQAELLMWEPLKTWCERLGIEATFNETKLRCTFKRNGATLRLVGADDKREIDKLRGQPFHEVGIDEAASYPTELLEQLVIRIIGPRLGDYGGVLWMIGTPGHILQGLFYDATRPGSDKHRPYADRDNPELAAWSGWSSHTWTLEDGADSVPAMARLWAEALLEKETNRWSDDHPVWLREYKGLWAADDTENIYKYRPHLKDGTPWNQWDPERVGPMRFAKLPEDFSDWIYGIGVDMGSKDPFALNVFALSPTDTSRTLYHVFCFDRTRMYAKLISVLLIGEEATERVLRGEHIDYERPGGGVFGVIGWPAAMVADLAALGEAVADELANVYGIRLEIAEKKGKFSAIELTNGDLVDGRIKVLKDSPLEKQLMSLQWVTDEFGQVKENKGQRNDQTDSLIYIRRRVALLFAAGDVASPAPASAGSYADPMDLGDSRGGGGEFDNLLGDGGFPDDDGWGNL